MDTSGNIQYIHIPPFTASSHITNILGNLYIVEHGNHRIRKVLASTSVISTIAGTGTGTHSGDNGQATSAALWYPVGVAVDTSGKDK
jgi:hypothetical protein